MVQVKGNQPTLLREIQRISIEQCSLDYFEEHEKGHGRQSSWFVHVFDATNSTKAKEWKNLRRVIHVHKRTICKGKESHHDRYYISDLYQTDAQKYHHNIRKHWTIENSLHWVKDVIHNEDHNGFKRQNAAVNVSIFSSIAINITRAQGCHSITDAQIKFGANMEVLFDLIRT